MRHPHIRRQWASKVTFKFLVKTGGHEIMKVLQGNFCDRLRGRLIHLDHPRSAQSSDLGLPYATLWVRAVEFGSCFPSLT